MDRVLEVVFSKLYWEALKPTLSLDDLYGYWYWVLAGRARRELSDGSNVSVGGMRAELWRFEVSSNSATKCSSDVRTLPDPLSSTLLDHPLNCLKSRSRSSWIFSPRPLQGGRLAAAQEGSRGEGPGIPEIPKLKTWSNRESIKYFLVAKHRFVRICIFRNRDRRFCISCAGNPRSQAPHVSFQVPPGIPEIPKLKILLESGKHKAFLCWKMPFRQNQHFSDSG